MVNIMAKQYKGTIFWGSKRLIGKENIFMSGAMLGLKKKYIKGKFDEIIELSGVVPFIDMTIKRYSSGMRVRLGFALARS